MSPPDAAGRPGVFCSMRCRTARRDRRARLLQDLNDLERKAATANGAGKRREYRSDAAWVRWELNWYRPNEDIS